MLSVSGARGIVGRTMTPEVAAAYAGAFGSFLRATTGAARPRVAVGLDGRISGPPLAKAAIGGLLATGCDVIDLGVAMTPSVGVMINHHRADGGEARGADRARAEAIDQSGDLIGEARLPLPLRLLREVRAQSNDAWRRAKLHWDASAHTCGNKAEKRSQAACGTTAAPLTVHVDDEDVERDAAARLGA
jgi:hypothetical protein